ncbi:MAG: putative eukaryotic snRNP-like RNA-binding protein [uncultured archaeon A07HB70]|nr:MAG: putative eukaryotic snRNP-like RNA-binding protein [uncultured archaeon A07HB70]
MEPKRELSSVDIAALVSELRAYEGAKVDKAYLYDEGLVRLRMRDFDRGRVEFLCSVEDPTFVVAADPERVPDAPGRPPNFAMMLRNRIANAELVEVGQYEFDRIVTLAFERGDERTTVVVELFGDGNLAVLDEHGEVVDSLRTVRLKSRTVAPGAPYEFPDSRLNPLAVSYDAFVARMEGSDTDVVRTLATKVNFGGLYAEEVCARADVAKTLAIADATDAEYEALYDAVDRLAADLRETNLDPRIYEEDEEVVDVTPFPLAEREGLDAESFDSFNRALDVYVDRLEREAGTEAAGEPDRPDFEAEIAKYERIVAQQEGAIEEFAEEAERYRDRAEAVYARYELVDEVLSTVRAARDEGHGWDDIEDRLAEGAERGIAAAEAVESVDGAAGTVTVRLDDLSVGLDPAEGVEHNADRLYREAKRVEEKREGAIEAVAETREQLEAAKARKEAWERDDDDAAAEDDDDADVDWLARSSVPLRTADHWYERFRWFHTSDDFLVVGGRDADQNEALVKKYLEGNDRFFHAQAHGGPVTVLKATGPSEPSRDVEIPDRSLAEAAQFAVVYSSVWKAGRFAGDAYEVAPSQVSKTPESGEYLEKGGFAVRGDRTYHRDVACEAVVGVQVEGETRVVGGPPSAVEQRVETGVRLRPGRYAQNDAAKLVYREFRERFVDQSFVRKVASPDLIQEFLPAGGSEMVD